jgi:WD40 repeat protein
MYILIIIEFLDIQAADSSKAVISSIVETMSDEQLSEAFGMDGGKTKKKNKTKKFGPGTGTLLMTKKLASSSFDSVKTLVTARSHLDSVRCVTWHSTEPMFLSASEDFTVKLWSLHFLDPKINKNKTAGKTATKIDKDILPARTYRGHCGQGNT